MSTQIKKIDTQPDQSQESALMTLISRAALDANFDVAKLQALMDMKERWEANEARKAYVEAMAEFKANAPEILKRKHVRYALKTGGETNYMHAELADVTDAVVQPLAQAGFSHAWRTQQLDGGLIEVTCTLTHKLGHTESVTLKSSADQSGGKNNIQAIASTVTYLERYTLLMATGLATKGMDDDGQAAGQPPMDTKDADWIATCEAIDKPQTEADCKAIKAELVKAYGMTEKVPRVVIAAYNAALHRVREEKVA